METNQINGFIVMKGAPGLRATKIENKIGLRIVQNGDILLKKVFVPEEDRLPGVNSFQDTSKVLAVSRVMVAWQPIGISMGVFDMCHLAFCDLEPIFSYEGTYDINSLVTGREITGIASFKPAALAGHFGRVTRRFGSCGSVGRTLVPTAMSSEAQAPVAAVPQEQAPNVIA
ncbi:hypothetical protein J5N97_013568 [Dioscorea zingiberensis]|uniref:Uncharacterized protein n=1 Tax=Dioscorea zingiberensis TaxID=325984 RepID=A0A9D5HIY3_9LILI|nr:hypothetical protein J5N97_013568 [Dioscorea zingiberensis]